MTQVFGNWDSAKQDSAKWDSAKWGINQKVIWTIKISTVLFLKHVKEENPGEPDDQGSPEKNYH